MRAKACKKIRRYIYGDLALKSDTVRKQKVVGGVIVNTGRRKAYQEGKKAYKNQPWKDKRYFITG